jgi:hypothetical protein
LASFSINHAENANFELYFDNEQIKGLSFEINATTNVNKENCYLHLSGELFVPRIYENINEIKEIYNKNHYNIIREELIQKRKELPTRKKDKKFEAEEESDEEIEETYDGPRVYYKETVRIREIIS